MLLVLVVSLALASSLAHGELVGSSSPTGSIPARGEGVTVLVLGSGGLIGAALTDELHRRGFTVLEAKNRMHLDLRVPGSLAAFEAHNISFCFFLACEVGGSKFIASGSNDKAIWRNNERMYDNVLPWLQQRGIRFLFSSSQLSVTGTAYGKAKALGEELITKMDRTGPAGRLGKFVRFWNVWGAEKVGLKSHILADWIYQCVKVGHVIGHTSGYEQRQFVHTIDMAAALIDLMHDFERLPIRVDITSGEWVSMRQLAAVLTDSSSTGCTIDFAERNSSTMIGIEPVYLWKVSSDIYARIQETFRYYEAAVLRESYAPYSENPYLSIIVCTTNDDYNGIRQRTFNFVQGVVTNAEASHLSYELIVVQYNPSVSTDYWADNFFLKDPTSDRDLSFSQLFPWTSRHSFGNMRIITVPSHLHRWSAEGSFWEYVGKNAGAQRARGQFLLFTNPDDIFPLTLFEQLSRQQLNPHKVYKAGVILNFQRRGTLAAMMSACSAMSASLYGPTFQGDLINFGASEELKKSIAEYSDPVYLEGGKALWKQEYVGDFSIFPRHIFLSLGGYLEVPQNTHIETGHLYAVTGDPTFAKSGYSMAFLDDVVCHQDHTRNGRPAAPLVPDVVKQLTANRTDRSTFGLRGADLPEARMDDIFDAAFNPETPFRTYPHHRLFRMFDSKLWTGRVHPDYVTDFLGINTSYYFDCADSGRYRFYHLSRRFPCARHEEYQRKNYSATGLEAMGDLPVVDEEYFEWLSMLKAVKHKLHQPVHQPFVVAELGARYGTWTVRAGAAMRLLQPHRPLKLLAVEADASGFEWLQAHLRVNRLASVTQTIRGFVSDKNDKVAFSPWERDSKADTVTSFTLPELLDEHQYVDIIHCDIQGFERVFASHMPLLNAKVKAIHFGTHSHEVHDQLKATFQDNGWAVTQDIRFNGGVMPGRVEHTGVGPVRILWDGILAVSNSRTLPAFTHGFARASQELQ